MDATVLILGAGASYDYGYPTGRVLTDKIGNLTFNENYLSSMQNWDKKMHDCIHPGFNLIQEHLRKSRTNSIDAWLAKPENSRCLSAGKFLIAHCLANCEKFDFTNGGFFQPLRDEDKNDWYRELVNSLYTDKFEYYGEKNKNLAIITFNYDRSLEHYLMNTLKSNYIDHTPEEYWEQLQSIKIYHVYGDIGSLPFMKTDSSFPYQSPKELQEIAQRSKSIRLISERDEHPEELEMIHSVLRKARRIFFIGFGYDPINLKHLGFPFQSESPQVNVYGTALGFEPSEKSIAESRIRIKTSAGHDVPIRLDDCNAYTFFRRYVSSALAHNA